MAERDPDDFRTELEAAQERSARAEEELAAAKREVEALRERLRKAKSAPARRPSRAPWIALYLAAFLGGAGANVASARWRTRVEPVEVTATSSPQRLVDVGAMYAKSPLRFEEKRRFPGATGGVANVIGIIGKDGVLYLPREGSSGADSIDALAEERAPMKDVLAATFVETPSDRFYVAVGSRGAAAVRRAGKWTVERTGVDATLLAVAADDDGRVFAVGEHGTIVRREPGVGWLAESSHVNEPLRAVAVSRAKAVVAAGDDGVVLVRGEGGDWARLRAPTMATLRAVLPSMQGAFFIAGDGGTLLMYDYDAARFSTLPPPDREEDLVAVAPYLMLKLLLATRSGKVLTYDSQRLQWSVTDVAAGEEIVGLSTTSMDAIVVTSSGRTFVGRVQPRE